MFCVERYRASSRVDDAHERNVGQIDDNTIHWDGIYAVFIRIVETCRPPTVSSQFSSNFCHACG